MNQEAAVASNNDCKSKVLLFHLNFGLFGNLGTGQRIFSFFDPPLYQPTGLLGCFLNISSTLLLSTLEASFDFIPQCFLKKTRISVKVGACPGAFLSFLHFEFPRPDLEKNTEFKQQCLSDKLHATQLLAQVQILQNVEGGLPHTFFVLLPSLFLC